jgi:hypothetical protein
MVSAARLTRDSYKIAKLNQWRGPPPRQECRYPRNSFLIKDLGEILPWLVLPTLTSVIYSVVM